MALQFFLNDVQQEMEIEEKEGLFPWIHPPSYEHDPLTLPESVEIQSQNLSSQPQSSNNRQILQQLVPNIKSESTTVTQEPIVNRHGGKRKHSVDEDRVGNFEPWMSRTDNVIMEDQMLSPNFGAKNQRMENSCIVQNLVPNIKSEPISDLQMPHIRATQSTNSSHVTKQLVSSVKSETIDVSEVPSENIGAIEPIVSNLLIENLIPDLKSELNAYFSKTSVQNDDVAGNIQQLVPNIRSKSLRREEKTSGGRESSNVSDTTQISLQNVIAEPHPRRIQHPVSNIITSEPLQQSVATTMETSSDRESSNVSVTLQESLQSGGVNKDNNKQMIKTVNPSIKCKSLESLTNNTTEILLQHVVTASQLGSNNEFVQQLISKSTSEVLPCTRSVIEQTQSSNGVIQQLESLQQPEALTNESNKTKSIQSGGVDQEPTKNNHVIKNVNGSIKCKPLESLTKNMAETFVQNIESVTQKTGNVPILQNVALNPETNSAQVPNMTLQATLANYGFVSQQSSISQILPVFPKSSVPSLPSFSSNCLLTPIQSSQTTTNVPILQNIASNPETNPAEVPGFTSQTNLQNFGFVPQQSSNSQVLQLVLPNASLPSLQYLSNNCLQWHRDSGGSLMSTMSMSNVHHCNYTFQDHLDALGQSFVTYNSGNNIEAPTQNGGTVLQQPNNSQLLQELLQDNNTQNCVPNNLLAPTLNVGSVVQQTSNHELLQQLLQDNNTQYLLNVHNKNSLQISNQSNNIGPQQASQLLLQMAKQHSTKSPEPAPRYNLRSKAKEAKEQQWVANLTTRVFPVTTEIVDLTQPSSVLKRSKEPLAQHEPSSKNQRLPVNNVSTEATVQTKAISILKHTTDLPDHQIPAKKSNRFPVSIIPTNVADQCETTSIPKHTTGLPTQQLPAKKKNIYPLYITPIVDTSPLHEIEQFSSFTYTKKLARLKKMAKINTKLFRSVTSKGANFNLPSSKLRQKIDKAGKRKTKFSTHVVDLTEQSTELEQTREVPAEPHTTNRQPIISQRSSVIVDLTQEFSLPKETNSPPEQQHTANMNTKLPQDGFTKKFHEVQESFELKKSKGLSTAQETENGNSRLLQSGTVEIVDLTEQSSELFSNLLKQTKKCVGQQQTENLNTIMSQTIVIEEIDLTQKSSELKQTKDLPAQQQQPNTNTSLAQSVTSEIVNPTQQSPPPSEQTKQLSVEQQISKTNLTLLPSDSTFTVDLTEQSSPSEQTKEISAEQQASNINIKLHQSGTTYTVDLSEQSSEWQQQIENVIARLLRSKTTVDVIPSQQHIEQLPQKMSAKVIDFPSKQDTEILPQNVSTEVVNIASQHGSEVFPQKVSTKEVDVPSQQDKEVLLQKVSSEVVNMASQQDSEVFPQKVSSKEVNVPSQQDKEILSQRVSSEVVNIASQQDSELLLQKVSTKVVDVSSQQDKEILPQKVPSEVVNVSSHQNSEVVNIASQQDSEVFPQKVSTKVVDVLYQQDKEILPQKVSSEVVNVSSHQNSEVVNIASQQDSEVFPQKVSTKVVDVLSQQDKEILPQKVSSEVVNIASQQDSEVVNIASQQDSEVFPQKVSTKEVDVPSQQDKEILPQKVSTEIFNIASQQDSELLLQKVSTKVVDDPSQQDIEILPQKVSTEGVNIASQQDSEVLPQKVFTESIDIPSQPDMAILPNKVTTEIVDLPSQQDKPLPTTKISKPKPSILLLSPNVTQSIRNVSFCNKKKQPISTVAPTSFQICTVSDLQFNSPKSSFFSIPVAISNTRSVINLQNFDDHKCFMWSVLAALHQNLLKSNTVSQLKTYVKELNMKGIKFPVSIDQIDLFEKLNQNITVNVFGFDSKTYPLRITKFKRQYHVNLLYLTCGRLKRYCFIRNLGRLLANLFRNAHASLWCNYCLGRFRKEAVLKAHAKICSPYFITSTKFSLVK